MSRRPSKENILDRILGNRETLLNTFYIFLIFACVIASIVVYAIYH